MASSRPSTRSRSSRMSRMIVSPACTHSPSWGFSSTTMASKGATIRRRSTSAVAASNSAWLTPACNSATAMSFLRFFDGKDHLASFQQVLAHRGLLHGAGDPPVGVLVLVTVGLGHRGGGPAVADIDVVPGLFFGSLQLVLGDVLLRPRHDVVDLGQQIALGNLLPVADGNLHQHPGLLGRHGHFVGQRNQALRQHHRIGRPDHEQQGNNNRKPARNRYRMIFCKAQK